MNGRTSCDERADSLTRSQGAQPDALACARHADDRRVPQDRPPRPLAGRRRRALRGRRARHRRSRALGHYRRSPLAALHIGYCRSTPTHRLLQSTFYSIDSTAANYRVLHSHVCTLLMLLLEKLLYHHLCLHCTRILVYCTFSKLCFHITFLFLNHYEPLLFTCS